MKRTFIVFAIAFLLMGSLAICDEATIVDFTLLQEDITIDKDNASTDENGNLSPDQNRNTVMNYGEAAGSTFTDDQKTLMKTSLAIRNWEVELNSSARSVSSLSESVVKPALVREKKPNSKGEEEAVKVPFAGKEVMGVRIVFPAAAVNASAKILPPYEIPAYEPMAYINDDGVIATDDNGNRVDADGKKITGITTRFENGFGVVKNVGTIKALSISTYGMNFPHGLYIRLKDTDNVERRYFMGYLKFDGWQELKWYNPNYISDVRTRELRVYPLYPRGLPYVKFIGLEITRNASDVGNDFIGYFKDVKIIYDKAILTTERDIVDEDLWHIVTDREAAKQNYEMSRFGNKQVDRFLEKSKVAEQKDFESSLKAENNQNADSQVQDEAAVR